MPDSRVTAAYGARAAEYAAVFGTVESVPASDRGFVLRWARSVVGPVIDAGCGPGQWTSLLMAAGVDVTGVDPTVEFVDIARQRYPAARFRVGAFDDLGVPDGSLGGVLAWYSMIHLEPTRLDGVLRCVARALAPHGSLLIGFCDGPAGERFDHAVTTAWWWSVPELTRRLAGVGLEVTDSETRLGPGPRPHGALVGHHQ